MSKILFIVESPGKIDAIRHYVGSGYRVEASNGHVRDLPPRRMGVGPPDFEPEQEVLDRAKGKVAMLRKASKESELVIIATDPDREGEGIAYDLHCLLKPKKYQRITFSAISQTEIEKALAKPGQLNMALVEAQKARRVLDRLFGYTVSTIVSASLGTNGLSAGRVQSAALRYLVELEARIQDFKAIRHFGVRAAFAEGWTATWNSKNWLEDDQDYILDRSLAERIAELKSFSVLNFKESMDKQAPPAPFTTSKIQKEASTALKMDPAECNKTLQELYEKGRITYIRTDSQSFSPEASKAILDYAASQGLPAASEIRLFKSKKGAQEAHEAIRPTDISVEAAGETEKQKALYKLIRDRALVSQLVEAEFSVREALLESGLDGRKVVFEAKGRRLVKPGWKSLAKVESEDESGPGEEMKNPVADLTGVEKCQALSSQVVESQTKPPARVSKAGLIQKMEKLGIGRPATYAGIVDQICNKGYVDIVKGEMSPNDLGKRIIGFLVGRFSFLEYGYTRDLEALLDDVAEGKRRYLEVVTEANAQLEKELEPFSDLLKKKPQDGPPCPACGKPLIHRKNPEKGYDFWGCSDWKAGCNATYDDDGGKPGAKREKREAPDSGHKCPKCGKALVMRTNREKQTKFWGCSGWKAGCSATFQDQDGAPDFAGRK